MLVYSPFIYILSFKSLFLIS